MITEVAHLQIGGEIFHPVTELHDALRKAEQFIAYAGRYVTECDIDGITHQTHEIHDMVRAALGRVRP